MDWQTPQFVEIKMDAEISSYQEDNDPTHDPAFGRPEVEALEGNEGG